MAWCGVIRQTAYVQTEDAWAGDAAGRDGHDSWVRQTILRKDRKTDGKDIKIHFDAAVN